MLKKFTMSKTLHYLKLKTKVDIIVRIFLNGNSEIVGHVRRNLCSLIRLTHLIRLIAVTNWIIFKSVLFSIIRAQHDLSYQLSCSPIAAFREMG